MQFHACILLSAAVLWLTLGEISCVPFSSTAEELEPLHREARETNGFYTAHQDGGISKYTKNLDSLQTPRSHVSNFEANLQWHQQYVNLDNASEATTANAGLSTDIPSVLNTSVLNQKEYYNDYRSTTESASTPTDILEKTDSEIAPEYQHAENSTLSSNAEDTTYFGEQEHLIEKDSDINEKPIESKTDNSPAFISTENMFFQTDSHTLSGNVNYYAFEEKSGIIPLKQESYTGDLEQAVSSNLYENNSGLTQDHLAGQVTKDTSPQYSALPKYSQIRGQETAMAPQQSANNQIQGAENDQNYFNEKAGTAQAQVFSEHSSINQQGNHDAKEREVITPSIIGGDDNYESSHSTPVYISGSNSLSNLHTYYHSSPTTQRTDNYLQYEGVGRQNGPARAELGYLQNLRNSRSFYYTPNFYKETPEKYVSTQQNPFISRSQVPSFYENSNYPTSFIQAPYSAKYKIYNVNIFDSLAAGDNLTPGNGYTRQLSWPFADYFPIIINDPFLAAYNAFTNVFEYGPDADICRRLNAQKESLDRGIKNSQDTAQYGNQQQVMNPHYSVYVPTETASVALPVNQKSGTGSEGTTVSGEAFSPTEHNKHFSSEADRTSKDEKPTEIIMSSNDTNRNTTFVTKLIVRKGGVSIAGPGGIATAGSGGLAIVGPGGVAYTSPNGMAIVGPGGKVVGLPSGGEIVFDGQDLSTGGEGARKYLTNIPPGGRVVAEGPTIYYHPPE